MQEEKGLGGMMTQEYNNQPRNPSEEMTKSLVEKPVAPLPPAELAPGTSQVKKESPKASSTESSIGKVLDSGSKEVTPSDIFGIEG
jgi:hypothetical protein